MRCKHILLVLVLALVVVVVPSLFSCSPGYVIRAAWEEARILARRRAIADVLNDPTLDMETRAKLELVVQARSFAARDLGLDVGTSYTSFSDIGRDTLALVLSASPVNRLAAYTWWFPVVGRVPYKGFFDWEAAAAEARELEEQHYETYLRPTPAFSTLGWLPDPLLSTLLSRDSVGLVETVVHEVTHNTLFVAGHVEFNESFANFVGSLGAIEFFCERGHDDALCELARGRWHDTLRFSEFLDRLWGELESLYAEEFPIEQLMPRREALIAELSESFRHEYAPTMRTDRFAQFDPALLNNASLIAWHLYYHRLYLFQALYDRTGSLSGAIEQVAAAVDGAAEPWSALEELVEGPPAS
ncbi:MAG: aminopeptidase [Gemmatimonadota bacterium]|nr:MAG: aminopeptidase [Gemmatimonadota bacterium]